MVKLDLLAIYLVVFSLIGTASLLLKWLHVENLFNLTFFFLGCNIAIAGVYDCFPPSIPGEIGWYLPLFEFWFWLAGIIPLSYFMSYLMVQKTYAKKVDKLRTKLYAFLIIGIILFFVPVENFVLYLYWGLEYFNPKYSCYQTLWINGIFPAFYLLAIPGIYLIIHACRWSVKKPGRVGN